MGNGRGSVHSLLLFNHFLFPGNANSVLWILLRPARNVSSSFGKRLFYLLLISFLFLYPNYEVAWYIKQEQMESHGTQSLYFQKNSLLLLSVLCVFCGRVLHFSTNVWMLTAVLVQVKHPRHSKSIKSNKYSLVIKFAKL